MDKLDPIKQPTDSRIRPLSDYSDKIEIREVEQGESGTIQEFLDLTDEEMAEIEKNCQHNKLSPLPWKVDGLCIYDADDHMVAEIKAAHWMTPEQVFANAQYIADALQFKQEMTKEYLCQCGSSYATKNEVQRCADSHQCSHTEQRYELRVLRDSSLAVWCCCRTCNKFIDAAYLDDVDWDDNQEILEQLYNKGKHHEL